MRAVSLPANVRWPSLVARCERRGIPVLRVDEHGDPHIIRTLAQLYAEWDEPQTPAQTTGDPQEGGDAA